MTAPFMARQGDVLLVAVKRIPRRVKLRKTARVRVAEGEATGHAHVVTARPQTEILTDDDRQFLRIVGASGLLVHEEHTAIELPPGDYQVVRQREYSPGRIGRFRRVVD